MFVFPILLKSNIYTQSTPPELSLVKIRYGRIRFQMESFFLFAPTLEIFFLLYDSVFIHIFN